MPPSTSSLSPHTPSSSLSHPPLVAEPGLSMGLTPYYTWLRRRTVCVCLSVVCLSRQTFTRRHALSDESTAKPMTSHHSTKARNGTLPAYPPSFLWHLLFSHFALCTRLCV